MEEYCRQTVQKDEWRRPTRANQKIQKVGNQWAEKGALPDEKLYGQFTSAKCQIKI